MNKRQYFGAMVAGLATVVLAGGLIASNMGFKLNYPLEKTGTNGSKSGTNTVALPFNRQTGVNKASDLFNDMGGKVNVASVQKFVITSDTFQSYTGRAGTGPDFPLAAGEGYFAKINNDVNYIIVGSDDPSLTFGLKKTGSGGSKSGTNLFAMPYHFTGTIASNLFDDLGGKVNVASVQKFIKSSDTVQSYTGRAGTGPNFTLVPGEAYYIKLNNDVNYVPSHY